MMTMGEEISALKAKVCSLTDQLTCADKMVRLLKAENARLTFLAEARQDIISNLNSSLARVTRERDEYKEMSLCWMGPK